LGEATNDKRRRVVRQENAGPSTARNRGLAEATAPYVAFLDVDDRWHPSYLSEMCAALDNAPGAAAALAGWRGIDDAGSALAQHASISPQQAAQLIADLKWRNAILPSAVVARRSAVAQAGGFDVELKACEDWDLWLRLIALGAFVTVPQLLLEYRIHSSSATDNIEHMERERLKLNAKHLGPLDEPLPAWPAIRRQAVGFTYFNSALGYLRSHNQARMVEKLQQAVNHWPGLLREDEFYYELACADQPRGSRGPGPTLNLAAGEEVIRSALFEWLAWDRGVTSRPRAWSQGNLVLARLATANRQPQLARHYALRALRAGPWIDKTRAARELARSLAPRWLVMLARSRQRRFALQTGGRY
jgi:GT2 family glycosyltransferase